METESHSYQCRECGLLFVQPGPRRNHIQSIHPEIANICEVKCFKNFYHVLLILVNKLPYLCFWFIYITCFRIVAYNPNEVSKVK